jgi:hypothetical protein
LICDPLLGAIVNVVVWPCCTVAELGLTVPLPSPTMAVETTKVVGGGGGGGVTVRKLAVMVQSAVIGPVVYVLPLRDPSHPLTELIS